MEKRRFASIVPESRARHPEEKGTETPAFSLPLLLQAMVARDTPKRRGLKPSFSVLSDTVVSGRARHPGEKGTETGVWAEARVGGLLVARDTPKRRGLKLDMRRRSSASTGRSRATPRREGD